MRLFHFQTTPQYAAGRYGALLCLLPWLKINLLAAPAAAIERWPKEDVSVLDIPVAKLEHQKPGSPSIYVGDKIIGWDKLEYIADVERHPISIGSTFLTPDVVTINAASASPYNQLLQRISKLQSPVDPNHMGFLMKFNSLKSKFPDYNAAYSKSLLKIHLLSDNDNTFPTDQKNLVAESAEIEQEIALLIAEGAAATPPLPEGTLSTAFLMAQFHSAESKAVSGPNSNYRRDRYRDILENCKIIGRIDSAGGTASCVLIGDHLVATAAHAVKDYGPLDFTIAFELENGGLHKYTQQKILFIEPLMDIAGVPTKLDLAVFEIAPESPENDVVKGLLPARLYMGNVKIDESIYLLGFPGASGGDIIIHDAAFTIYPHYITNENLSVLANRAVLQNLTKRLGEYAYAGRFDAITDKIVADEFNLQRKLLEYLYPAAPRGRFYVRGPLPTAPNRVPIFGIDADASEGDSGGGVFSKNMGGNLLTGIFVSGEKGSDRVYMPNLLQHEHAIPSSVIVNFLKSYYPDSLTKYGITPSL